MQVGGEIERKVTLGREGAEVEGGESPEKAIRKFHARFMKLVGVLRPRCSTPGKYLRGSLSKVDPTEPAGVDRQEAGHCAYQDDRILDLYICVCSFLVYTP